MAEPDPRDADDPQAGPDGATRRTNGTNGVHASLRPRAAVLAAHGRVIGLADVRRRPSPAARAALAHGVWFLAIGLWPLVHPASFLVGIGTATDPWPLRAAALLAAAIGLVLLVARRRHRISQELMLLGLVTALGLAGIEFAAASSRRLAALHVGDGVVQVALAGAWALALARDHRERARPRFGRSERTAGWTTRWN